ncbi:doublecortin domain-containing protein 2-like isoform X2 [Amphiprion ocellaris]|uniref:Doublecortin domain-containing protein 2 n=1 Tax=Amphiprion ocellaris TaxID=80972 RepID=A0AAQ5ZTD7_AMPOC|nr:doublecortin domain-containing protein 2-like isoform X2 [Amphiprion ocellaris]
MSSEKPNFLSQPVVKNVFMFRNGDPYYEARRIVINEKRVCNFETLLREVTGGIQAPFGAVRNIYTPRGGHRVDCLESLQSGEQYVAAGRERFKKLDYLQIGSKKKRMLQTLPMQAKPLPQNRIIVSARFLKPIKEPCTVFVVANGDVLNPAMRLLIHQRMLGQFDKILEMITEKMGLRVLGGVRSLYTYEGQQVSNGNQLESGQLYVAVGRERFKKLPYSDLLFTKPRGTRRVKGMKAYSLPPIYRFSKQSVNNKSLVRCSDSGDGESKASPPNHNGTSKEHLSSIVREISQARLLSMRKRRSRQSLSLDAAENDDVESKADEGNAKGKPPQDQPDKAKLNTDDAKEENGEKVEEKEEAASENTKEEDASTNKEDKKEEQETNGEKEGGDEKKETDEQNDGEATVADEQKVEEVNEEVKEEVRDESKEEVKSEEQGSDSDKTQDSKEKQEENHTSSEDEKEQDKDIEEEKEDKDGGGGGGGEGEKSRKDSANDVDTGEEVKESENSSDPEKTEPDSETKEDDNSRSSSSNSNQEEDVSKIKDEQPEERKVNGEVSGEDNGVESEAELDVKEKNSSTTKDATENGEKEEDKESRDES